MLRSALGFRGGIVAPHRVAALAGRDILEQGGSAIEAIVAAAATIAVVYPHMNGVGGDAFWIVKRPGEAAVGISGCGRAAGLATAEFYAAHGHTETIPARGALSALTVPGSISSWDQALALQCKTLPLRTLLAPAIRYAHDGTAVTGNQSTCTTEKLSSLCNVPGFSAAFLVKGQPPAPGHRLLQTALGSTLEHLAVRGLQDFYTGDTAYSHAAFLQDQGSPLRFTDFKAFTAERVVPLSVQTREARLFNMVPPTQGISSLMILALFDRWISERGLPAADGFDHVHALVEITKRVFLKRNAELGDPDAMATPAESWLEERVLGPMLSTVNPNRALPWPHCSKDGDTIWMGAVDKEGTVVSFIQSVFWEFGSGLTCPTTGVFFQNRGAGFSLSPGPNQIFPGKRPFHTLNPALAELSDGRVLAYGTMGGEGQPQTQSAIFTRYAHYGIDLQDAVTRPRWLLGRTWGEHTTTLKLEDRFASDAVAGLRAAGHDVEMIAPFSDLVGHAGALSRHAGGLIEGAADPRADGVALVY